MVLLIDIYTFIKKTLIFKFFKISNDSIFLVLLSLKTFKNLKSTFSGSIVNDIS